MTDRKILHSDANCFFASVETVKNPDLKGKAVAVCGSVEDRHGIVLAKSELAKQAGVKTGMIVAEAKRLCPSIIIVHPHYDEYVRFSGYLREIYGRYSQFIEPFGLDECWIDVTNSKRDAFSIAEEIRGIVKDELGLTVSIGVSFNKVYAKLGSDLKKPDAVTEITRQNYKGKVFPLPCQDLLYCGKATTKKLNAYGIYTIGDLANSDKEFCRKILGKNGEMLWEFANGNDTSAVAPEDYRAPMKSISHGVTCSADLLTNDEVWRVMLEISSELGQRLRSTNLRANGVQITIRDDKLNFYQMQCKMENAVTSSYIIAKKGYELFCKTYDWKNNVRAVTLSAINLGESGFCEQEDMFGSLNKIDKIEKLEKTIDKINDKYGNKAVRSAVLYKDSKIPESADSRAGFHKSIK